MQCDLKQPECGQCIKSNRPCTGYHRETIFKNSGLAEVGAGDSAVNQSTIPAGKIPGSGHANGRAVSGPAPQRSSRASKALALPKSVQPRNAHRAQILNAFIDAFLPDAEKSQGLGGRRPISWLQAVPSVREHGDALSTALTALSLARLGRLSRDRRLSMEAKVLYGTALTHLQGALSSKNLMYRDDTLGACMALELYEVSSARMILQSGHGRPELTPRQLLECSNDGIDGWLIHASGTSQLVLARGPSLHRSSLSHHLFLGFRTGAVRRISPSGFLVLIGRV